MGERETIPVYQIFHHLPPLPESEFVQHPDQPMALRVSSRLLVGITRVHQKQAHYVYGELHRSSSAAHLAAGQRPGLNVKWVALTYSRSQAHAAKTPQHASAHELHRPPASTAQVSFSADLQ